MAEQTPLCASVFNAMNIGAFVLDAQQRIVMWNRWMVTHSGRAADAAGDGENARRGGEAGAAGDGENA